MTGRRVVLICGPPGAGKTTWAKASGLTVYDRDDPQWTSETHYTQAIAQLAHQTDAQAAVISAGATASARHHTAALIDPTETLVLDLDATECKRRVRKRARPTPPMRQQFAAIDRWWSDYQPPPPTTSRNW